MVFASSQLKRTCIESGNKVNRNFSADDKGRVWRNKQCAWRAVLRLISRGIIEPIRMLTCQDGQTPFWTDSRAHGLILPPEFSGNIGQSECIHGLSPLH